MKPGIVIGVGAAALSIWLACASTQSEKRTSGSAPAAKYIEDGCERAEESLASADFVEGQALATLRWTGMSKETRDLKIPVYVVGIESDELLVRFLQFPMREQYLHIWLGTGHIRPAATAGEFLLDPCSATLERVPR